MHLSTSKAATMRTSSLPWPCKISKIAKTIFRSPHKRTPSIGEFAARSILATVTTFVCCSTSTDWGFPAFATIDSVRNKGFRDKDGSVVLNVKIAHADDDSLLDDFDSKKTTGMVGLKNQVRHTEHHMNSTLNECLGSACNRVRRAT